MESELWDRKNTFNFHLGVFGFIVFLPFLKMSKTHMIIQNNTYTLALQDMNESLSYEILQTKIIV